MLYTIYTLVYILFVDKIIKNTPYTLHITQKLTLLEQLI